MRATTVALALICGSTAGAVVVTPDALAQPLRPANHSLVGSSVLDPRSALGWDDQRWDREMDALTGAGIDDVVLQASADLVDGRLVTYFPSDLPDARQATGPDGVPVDVVDTLLAKATAAGLTVWVGLLRDLRPTRFAPDSSIGQLLHDDAVESEHLADALAARLPSGATVAGWYLPAEINTNYVAEPARGAIIEYFHDLTARLHGGGQGHPVMTAPYFNAAAGVSVGQWRALWTDVLDAAALDVVALQDGTGDDPGRPRDPAELRRTLATWYGAVDDAIRASGRPTRLWAALDLYEFTGASAPIRDVAAHRAAVDGLVSGYTSFSFANQVSPWTLGSSAYLSPFRLWNRTGTFLPGRPSPPGRAQVRRRGDRLVVGWRPATLAPGKYLAYYRVLRVTGDGSQRYAATAWGDRADLPAGATRCVVVVAYDTTGDHSVDGRTCRR